ncbi:MAG: hypothetical protein WC533_02760 [Candidatus Pacearchaeota archaeon]
MDREELLDYGSCPVLAYLGETAYGLVHGGSLYLVKGAYDGPTGLIRFRLFQVPCKNIIKISPLERELSCVETAVIKSLDRGEQIVELPATIGVGLSLE